MVVGMSGGPEVGWVVIIKYYQGVHYDVTPAAYVPRRSSYLSR
jgi:hypothetical protein